MILFSEYARVNIPNAWKGDRNPVKYASLKDVGIDPSNLKREPMPSPTTGKAASRAHANVAAVESRLTIAEAKKALALTFGVPSEAVEIVIRE